MRNHFLHSEFFPPTFVTCSLAFLNAMTESEPPLNVQAFPAYSLLLLLTGGALFLMGCGATAPVTSSIQTPDTLETEESGQFRASLENRREATKPLSSTWRFGDGSTASGEEAQHAYSSTGSYRVQFIASNEGGADTSRASVTVVPPPQPASITSIDANPNPVDEGKTVRFSSNVQGDAPITRNWSFGDGSTAMGESPTHTYREPGQYTARLQASNDVGQDRRTVTVRVNRVLPEVCTTVGEFNSAFFERNSSTLTDEARSSLQENADVLSKCPNLSINVEAFAAPGERNPQSLSEDRASAVAEFYQTEGVPANRIQSSGQGRVEGVTSKKGGTRQYRRADSIMESDEGGM